MTLKTLIIMLVVTLVLFIAGVIIIFKSINANEKEDTNTYPVNSNTADGFRYAGKLHFIKEGSQDGEHR